MSEPDILGALELIVKEKILEEHPSTKLWSGERKMSYEEVAELLDSDIEIARGEMALVLLMAKQAVEKQIPKKPLKQAITLYLSKATDVLCPACNQSVCTWISLNSHSRKVPYCRHCGQALDWSDENA